MNSDQKRRSSKIYCSNEFSVQLRDFATVLAWVPGSSLDYHYDDEDDDQDDDENDGDDDDAGNDDDDDFATALVAACLRLLNPAINQPAGSLNSTK